MFPVDMHMAQAIAAFLATDKELHARFSNKQRKRIKAAAPHKKADVVRDLLDIKVNDPRNTPRHTFQPPREPHAHERPFTFAMLTPPEQQLVTTTRTQR